MLTVPISCSFTATVDIQTYHHLHLVIFVQVNQPQLADSLWSFRSTYSKILHETHKVNLSLKATGNMHKKLVKIARVVPEISCRTERQTDRCYCSQYFATIPAGEVIISNITSGKGQAINVHGQISRICQVSPTITSYTESQKMVVMSTCIRT